MSSHSKVYCLAWIILVSRFGNLLLLELFELSKTGIDDAEVPSFRSLEMEGCSRTIVMSSSRLQERLLGASATEGEKSSVRDHLAISNIFKTLSERGDNAERQHIYFTPGKE